ncbi:hypothetical protein BDV95DRAFT_635936 [Massariosphaeria phaeospora]|uniref:Uncharacterized protein n=1 Tax=Massariosphaeria phaeospora TaxID=100035 RepID=A0A7C8M9C4_9PLEO|nr:hypothetical protein BDV95DRAFT_635936 [Massariosphaeria phaeospora]
METRLLDNFSSLRDSTIEHWKDDVVWRRHSICTLHVGTLPSLGGPRSGEGLRIRHCTNAVRKAPSLRTRTRALYSVNISSISSSSPYAQKQRVCRPSCLLFKTITASIKQRFCGGGGTKSRSAFKLVEWKSSSLKYGRNADHIEYAWSFVYYPRIRRTAPMLDRWSTQGVMSGVGNVAVMLESVTP